MSEHAAQTIPCPSCGMALGRHVNAEGHDACTCGWDSAGFELMLPPAPCTCNPYSPNDPDCPQHGYSRCECECYPGDKCDSPDHGAAQEPPC